MNCQCPAPGHCVRYARRMNPHLHDLCQSRPDYRQAFARMWGLHVVREPETVPPCSQCCHAGTAIGTITTPIGINTLYRCHLHVETTPSQCEHCPDRDRKPEPLPSVPDSFASYLPITRPGSPKRWACGVVTVPRRDETFDQSLRSMMRAGFDSPTIFAEPGSPIADDLRTSLRVVQRDTVAHAWGNWCRGLEQLLEENPDADAFMIAQDDILYAETDGTQTLREYLDQALWPDDGTNVYSIYCAHKYTREDAGWFTREERWTWGACCFVWPRESLRHFLSTTARDWTSQGRTHKVDIAVGTWAKKHGRQVVYCCPSLVQHVGHTSTIWKGSGNNATGRRAAKLFLGDMITSGGAS